MRARRAPSGPVAQWKSGGLLSRPSGVRSLPGPFVRRWLIGGASARHAEGAGSIPARRTSPALVAQWKEPTVPNREVGGSTPSRRASFHVAWSSWSRSSMGEFPPVQRGVAGSNPVGTACIDPTLGRSSVSESARLISGRSAVQARPVRSAPCPNGQGADCNSAHAGSSPAGVLMVTVVQRQDARLWAGQRGFESRPSPLRDSAAAARRPHKPEVTGSSPVPAVSVR